VTGAALAANTRGTALLASQPQWPPGAPGLDPGSYATGRGRLPLKGRSSLLREARLQHGWAVWSQSAPPDASVTTLREARRVRSVVSSPAASAERPISLNRERTHARAITASTSMASRYFTPGASRAASGRSENGWWFWLTDPKGKRSLHDLSRE